MTFNGPVFVKGDQIETQVNIGTNNGSTYSGTTNLYRNPPQPKKEDYAEEVPFEEVKEEDKASDAKPPAVGKRDYSKSSVYPYLTDKSKAGEVIEWMREEMKQLKKPRERLRIVRALYEGDYFTSRLPCQVYIDEFEKIPESTYYHWMGKELRYTNTELDSVISQYKDKNG